MRESSEEDIVMLWGSDICFEAMWSSRLSYFAFQWDRESGNGRRGMGSQGGKGERMRRKGRVTSEVQKDNIMAVRVYIHT